MTVGWLLSTICATSIAVPALCIPAGAAQPRVSLLAGTWTCRDGANVISTLRVRSVPEGLALAETAPPPRGTTTAAIRRNAAGVWSVDETRPLTFENEAAVPRYLFTPHAEGTLQRTAAGWDIEGTLTRPSWQYRPPAIPFREHYVFTGADTFYRDSTIETTDVPIEGEMCVRGTSPPTADRCPAPELPPSVVALSLHLQGTDVARLGVSVDPFVGGPARLDPTVYQAPHGGEVVVAVSLDERSHVVGAKVVAGTNRALNAGALYIARSATYRTRFVDCRPVASEFLLHDIE